MGRSEDESGHLEGYLAIWERRTLLSPQERSQQEQYSRHQSFLARAPLRVRLLPFHVRTMKDFRHQDEEDTAIVESESSGLYNSITMQASDTQINFQTQFPLSEKFQRRRDGCSVTAT